MRRPHLLLAVLCAGLAGAAVLRPGWPAAIAVAGAGAAAAATGRGRLAVAVLVALAGWVWGGARLGALDRSPLLAHVGTAERATVEVLAPPKRTQFALRVDVRVLAFGRLHPHERVLLQLPLGRAPPLGARLDVLGTLALPPGPKNGFDERTWLRRQGVHVVLRASRWRMIGRRGGLGGFGDRLHRRLARDAVPGLRGERRALLEAVVLGEDGGISQALRQRFRASGLSHLLVVSGAHVGIVALGTLAVALLLGLPRLAAEAAVLAVLGGYVLAVGPQPSVLRAAIGGALGSLAWITARQRDALYALALAATLLLAWSPYNALQPGFQLSFVAVLAIFFLAPPIAHRLEGYPLPDRLRSVVAVSAACGIATAPISWLQFHQIPLLTVPANVVAAPVLAPMIGLALTCALLAPVAPAVAALLAHVNGGCAAYLAACARFFGGLPGAQIRSTRGLLLVVGLVLLAAAYAWRNAERAEAGLPAHR